MSRCHGNPSSRIPRLFEVAVAHARGRRGAFKLKETAAASGGGSSSSSSGLVKDGPTGPSRPPSRRACYADCRQAATASGLPYHHPSGQHQSRRRHAAGRCAISTTARDDN